MTTVRPAGQADDQPTSAASEALGNLISRIADTKYALGRRYAEWCTAAPNLESAVAAAAMAQDELGHARGFYPLLRQYPAFAGVDEPETRADRLHPACLDQAFQHWTDFVAANALLDSALTEFFVSVLRSPEESLAQRARKIVLEEEVHAHFGIGWLRRLARERGGVRAQLIASCVTVWPQALAWYGADDGDIAQLTAAGVTPTSPSQLRARLHARLTPILTETGLAADLVDFEAAPTTGTRAG